MLTSHYAKLEDFDSDFYQCEFFFRLLIISVYRVLFMHIKVQLSGR